MSRGLRNHNPGNIRHSTSRFRGEVSPSTDPAFKQFTEDAWGYRAIFVILNTYRRRHGLRTMGEMIRRWAPPAENATEHYILTVAHLTGLRADSEIDPSSREVMLPLAAAISQVENGTPADPIALRRGWELYRE